MRRITVYFICLFMMLGNIKFVSADTEINRIMNNKNQDVLFVGSVTYVSDNYFVLSAKDYINTESTSEAIAKRTEDHRYVIMKNENIKYTSSYHEKTTVENEIMCCIIKEDKREMDHFPTGYMKQTVMIIRH